MKNRTNGAAKAATTTTIKAGKFVAQEAAKTGKTPHAILEECLEFAMRASKPFPSGAASQIVPADCFQFDDKWGREFNTLLMEAGPVASRPTFGAKLFLADMDGNYNFDATPTPALDVSKLEPVSVVDACAWYARCQPFSEGHTGDVGFLCEMAADALQA